MGNKQNGIFEEKALARETKISASEINRFCFCPYQWYYEKKYGRTNLIKLKKEKFEELGLTDYSKSNFKNGIEFHNKFLLKLKLKLAFKIAVLLLTFILTLVIYLNYV